VDIIRFGTNEIRPIRSKTGWAFSTVIFLSVVGCSWPQPKAVSPVSSPSIAQLAQTTAQIRGLPFKWQVTLSDQPPATNVPGADEYGTQGVAQLSRVYKRIGLLSESVDLGTSLTEFSKLRRSAFYEAERRTIILAPEAEKMGQALAGAATPDASALAAVMALTHALQEQHFQWQERVRGLTLEDRKLAFRAVAEGDAMRVALSFLKADQSPATWTDQVQAIGRLTRELESAASSLPTMLREKLIFPYREGSQFVQWAYAAKGWEGVNGLFADPPVSSAQILHPEKYYLRREAPVQITPFGLFRQAKEEAVIEQTVGEYLVQVLLATSHSRQEAALIASGWTGDYLSAYADGNNLNTIWLSAWNDDDGAQKFFRALQTVFEGRHRLRFEVSPRPSDGLKADFGAGRSVVLQAKGSLVLLLDGVASARAAETSEAIWKELEIGRESPPIPFETAKGTAHLSWTKK
jgi:hypothetical protein